MCQVVLLPRGWRTVLFSVCSYWFSLLFCFLPASSSCFTRCCRIGLYIAINPVLAGYYMLHDSNSGRNKKKKTKKQNTTSLRFQGLEPSSECYQRFLPCFHYFRTISTEQSGEVKIYEYIHKSIICNWNVFTQFQGAEEQRTSDSCSSARVRWHF